MIRKNCCSPNTFLVIDNFNEDMKMSRTGSEVIIGGNNEFWEFSGWRKGIRWLEASNRVPDVCLFVNDAFLNYEERGLHEFYYGAAFNMIGLERAKMSAIGLRSSGDPLSTIGEIRVNEWIKSNIFALPASIALRLQWCYLDRTDIDQIFPIKFSGDLFLPDAPLSKELKHFLKDWIVGSWQFHRPIEESNWNFIRSKLTAILNERLLSAELRSFGCPINFLGRPNFLAGCVDVQKCSND